jgi:hypothetical protein
MYGNDIYYNPEKFGLEKVGEFDWADPDYSFDICCVWKAQRGQYWVGNDSGCSCPSPFENVNDINELDGPYTKDGLRKRLNWLVEENSKNSYGFSKAVLKKSASDLLSRLA